jgi:hypothetical protein
MLNRSEIVILTSWIRPPPAVPCRALPAINVCICWLKAQMMELPKKSAAAPKIIGLRPQISENLAQMGAADALASRYAAMAHVDTAEDFKSAAIVGTAVAIIV